MSYEPKLIAAFTTGLDTDVQPWILPQDAFQSIVNAYVHHGVITKRAGIQLFGYMVRSSLTTVSAITRAAQGTITVASAVGIANGDWFQVRNATGMTQVNNVTYMVSNLVGNTFDIVTIYGEAVDTSSFSVYTGSGEFFPVPQLPIMGIRSFIDTNSALQTLIFNTKRGAIYNAGTGVFDPLDTADIFNGTPSSFISSSAFGKTNSFATSTFYFSNFNGNTSLPISPIMQFTTGSTTSTFVPNTTPTLGTANYVVAAQFIFAIRQRLLLLNTVESSSAPSGSPPTGSGVNYTQRMRWSRANNPAASGSNWDEVTPGNGGFVDAPTSEGIISAKQLQDVIIVYFTSSVWSIEPTSDPALPFRWVKINSFRACEAPYATIGHDRYSVSYGKRGIVACDRVEVKRIDDKIQMFIPNEVNLAFVDRMFSERNYTERRSWTLYPSSTNNINPSDEAETSNYALIRTEEEGAWSIYNVTLTDLDPDNGTNMSSLGFGEVTQDLAFQDFTGSLDLTYEQFGSETWSSFFTQGDSEIFLGGDQVGRVLFLEKDGDDLGQDIDCEVTSAGWNPYKEQGLQAQLGYVDFYVDADEDTQFTVEFFADDIDNAYASQTLNCLPNLGFIADIQDVFLNNPVQVVAAQNGLSTGDEIFIYDLSGADDLSGGPYTVTVIDEDNFTLDGVDGTAFPAYGGGGQIVQRRFENTKCWKRAYAGGKGYQHYVKITNSGSDDILRFNAFMPWFRPVGSRIIGG